MRPVSRRHSRRGLVGGSTFRNLLDFINIIENELIKEKVLPKDYDFDSLKELVPMQNGDVSITYADTTSFENDFHYKPLTKINEGMKEFIRWYIDYYKINHIG